MTALAGRRILVVEDLFYLAVDLRTALEGAGAAVVGPFATTARALAAMSSRAGPPPHCAILDINLGTDTSFGLARALRMRGIPLLFFTGYDRSAIPAEFSGVERLEKPLDPRRLLRAVERCCRDTDPA